MIVVAAAAIAAKLPPLTAVRRHHQPRQLEPNRYTLTALIAICVPGGGHRGTPKYHTCLHAQKLVYNSLSFSLTRCIKTFFFVFVALAVLVFLFPFTFIFILNHLASAFIQRDVKRREQSSYEQKRDLVEQ